MCEVAWHVCNFRGKMTKKKAIPVQNNTADASNCFQDRSDDDLHPLR